MPRLFFTALSIFSLILVSLNCSQLRLKKTTKIPTSQLPLPVKNSDRPALIHRANEFSKSIKTLKLKVSYKLTGGTIDTGEIKRWRESEGFILLRKPSNIRVIVQAFQVRVLDMVSDGEHFMIEIPPKNQFIKGLNNQVIPPRKELVYVRPQHIFEALAINPLDESHPSLISLEEDQQARRKFYILSCHQWLPGRVLDLKRKIWFDRFDLNIVRQRAYSNGGKLETEIFYSDFREVNGQMYPSLIRFSRPQEAYSLLIRAKTIQINTNLEDNAFVLNKSPHAEEIDLTKNLKSKTLG